MNRYLVTCTDRRGMQHGCTFDVPENGSVIRQGWNEAIRLCGRIASVGSAYIYTIEGSVIGTLR